MRSQEEAKKAAIQATNSTITAAGSAIGGVVLGPGGAMLGGAVGKGLGIAFEKSVADTVEENVRGSLGQQTLATGAIEIALGAAGGGGGAVGGAAFSGLTQGATTGVAGAAGSFVSSQAGSLVIGGKG